MNLSEFREQYPEYDDISDKDIKRLLQDKIDPEAEDMMIPAIMGVEQAVRELTFPEGRADDIVTALESIESMLQEMLHSTKVEDGMRAIVGAVKAQKVEVPTVDFSPVVKALTEIKAMLSEPVVQVETRVEDRPKEWTFEVKRNKNGFVDEVVARA